MPETSHYLGIDWGKSDIGLAIADSETRIAMVLGVLKNDQNFFHKLSAIVAEKGIDEIIIGVPSYIYQNVVNPSTKNDKVRFSKQNNNCNKFGAGVKYEGEKIGMIIEKMLKIKVYYQNEMFTTKMAQANLIEKGMKHIKKHDDEEAARIILQDWLDKNK
jgi:RNase H-fold protein (predicted Holliday junction resolvase)